MNTVTIHIPEGAVVLGGISVFHMLDDKGEHALMVSNTGDSPLWSQIGWLQGALDRQRKLLGKIWGF